MNCLTIILLLAGQPQDDPQDLKRQIEAKREELKLSHTTWDEEERLKDELNDLWRKLKGPPPSHLVVEATGRYTFWDHDLGIGDSPGVGLNVVVPTTARFSESGAVERASPFEFGVRRWQARDERASGDVDVVSYRLGGGWRDTLSDNFGIGLSISFGLTRFNSDAPGGDQDTALNLTIDFPHCKIALGRSFWIGGSLEWDILRTSFNQDRTRTVFGLAPLISVEYSF